MSCNARIGLRLLRTGVAGLAASILLLASAFADTGTGGIGGTGHSSSSGQGLGGTGRSAGDFDGSGIGGTGMPLAHEGSGIGGTGIVGVITGFGSIWVNGVEVHYHPDMPVTTPAGTVSTSDLAVGQVVMARAVRDGDQAQALQLQLLPSVAGPVELADDERIRVAGQTVRLSSGSTAPAVGDWVVVSGLPRADDTLQATSILPYADDQPVTVYGRVRAANASGADIAIKQLPVRLPDSQQPPPAGTLALVSGHLYAGNLIADRVTVAPISHFAAAADEVRIQGYVQTAAEGRFSVGGMTFERHTQPGDVQTDQLVIVEGHYGADGNLIADQIETPDQPLRTLSLPPAATHNRPAASGRDGDESEDGAARQSHDGETPENAHTGATDSEASDQEVSADHAARPSPDLAPPDDDTIETPHPEVETPELDAPEVEAPEVEAPEVETPEVEVPEVEAPEVEVPEVEAPEVETPEIYEPPEIQMSPG